ncbi:MAG: hypothetical protein FWG92_04525 [Leptospirales bacterium]|nr:hypothetical protein [Leptospirales bacterium]
MKYRILFTCLMCISALGNLFALGDYASSERMLRDNRAFLDFIDVSITNLGIEDENVFRKAYEMHFNADLSYIRGDYGQTFRKIYDSQRELASICYTILKEKYLDDSKNTMGLISGGVEKSKNVRARGFLILGYRDRAAAEEAFTIGDGSYRKFFSLKIFKYQEAINLVRKAQRFAYMALFESLTPETRLEVYNEIVRQESEAGRGHFFARFLGKEGEEFDKEMALTFDEAMERSQTAGENQGFATRIDRRLHFKRESDVARYIKRHDFYLAEGVFKRYIRDFNFKLSYAMCEILGQKGDPNAPKLDYEKMKIQVIDSYGRFSKDSILHTYFGNVNIDDDNRGAGVESSNQVNEPKQVDGT